MWLSGKESACQCMGHRRCRYNPWIGKISWRRKWQPAPEFMPGKSHGQRSLAGHSPGGCKESDMIEHIRNEVGVFRKRRPNQAIGPSGECPLWFPVSSG